MSYKCLAFAGQEDFLSNIVHLSNVGSMLGQRRRRWPNIKTALDQCLVLVVSCNQFSGYINAVNLYSIGYCWPTLDRPRHARFEAGWFFNRRVSRTIPCRFEIYSKWLPSRKMASLAKIRCLRLNSILSLKKASIFAPAVRTYAGKYIGS